MAVLNVECVSAVVTFESDCDEKNFLDFFFANFLDLVFESVFFLFHCVQFKGASIDNEFVKRSVRERRTQHKCPD
jgi:hypothetical protein